MKLIVLEDIESQTEHLRQLLQQYEEEHPDIYFSVEFYDKGFALLDHYRCDADILILDIQVPDMLGIEVARAIRKADKNVTIVFLTNLMQYAVEGYSVQAFDYILKPLNYVTFKAKMDRIIRKLELEKTDAVLSIKTKEGMLRIPVSIIQYLEVLGHDVYIHTGTQTIKQWGSLSKFEKMLPEKNFVRCNSCYLVNLKYVQGMKGDCVIVKGQELVISRPQRKPFLAALAEYKGGR